MAVTTLLLLLNIIQASETRHALNLMHPIILPAAQHTSSIHHHQMIVITRSVVVRRSRRRTGRLSASGSRRRLRVRIRRSCSGDLRRISPKLGRLDPPALAGTSGPSRLPFGDPGADVGAESHPTISSKPAQPIGIFS
nr:hypothetical protein Iba_chr14bCG1600 [Ipomoea batatas]